ncbi:MAG: GtrA family protein [Lachnospirales bacterium]
MYKKEILKYILIGFLTTLISFIFYYTGIYLGVNYGVANILSNVVSIIFAFFANTYFVFTYKTKGVAQLLLLFCKFSSIRIIFMFGETFLLFIIIDLLSLDPYIAKFISTAIVILMNYIVSKFFIYQ